MQRISSIPSIQSMNSEADYNLNNDENVEVGVVYNTSINNKYFGGHDKLKI